MGGRAGLVLCPEAKIYDHGPEHPLRPQRVQYTWDLIAACGLLERPGVSTLRCRSAGDEELGLVHSDAYIDATRRAGHGEDGDWSRFGYGPGDNPIFPQMHEAGALVAGASIVAAESVHTGAVDHAFNAAGGLHHAMPSRASGFCVYDDPAIAIAWLLREGVHPIAYVDVDVHHGDGPQAIFYEDPRVLTISLHESGEYLFPGTGFVTERGAAAAEGTKVNVPLPPGTGDRAWLAAFDAIVPPILRAFRPAVLVSQLGCDTHASDPLAHFRLTTGAYRETAGRLHALAHSTAGGRWIATGGGGYRWADVVPRAWTLYFAEMCEAELPDALPETWIEKVELEVRREVPATFTEPPIQGDRVTAETESIIDQVRRTSFPHFGLDA
ncbi:MAG: acetoin utilization protein AcuC [Actinomycetota bacterium]